MNIQSAALNELFVLYPVIIQGWISPVLPVGTADGGIPKSLYDGVPTGLECLVDPWTEVRSGTLAVDDRVDLYVNDAATPVHGKTINPGEENLRIRLYVPHGQLQDGVNTLHYVVTRPGGNGSDKSRVLTVLYHLRAPGEPAPAGMRLQIPTAVRDQGVDAEQAAQGVVFGFDYANRRAYDRIRLTLGTVSVDRNVAPGEVGPGQPVITQTLFTETFKRSGDNPNTLVFYRVTDQLGNSNTSADDEIDVHLDRLTLRPPSVKEAPDGKLNPIDAENTLTIVVPHYTGMLATDKLSVTWAGTVGAGSHTSRPIDVGTVGIKNIPIPNTVVAFNLGKPVTVTYTVTRNGIPQPPSDAFMLSVLSIPVDKLKQPLILEAANSGEGLELDLNNVTKGGTMRFRSWPHIAVGQYVWLDLFGFKANGAPHNVRLMKAPGSYVYQGWIDQGHYDLTVPYSYLKELGDGRSLKMLFKATLNKSQVETEAVSFPERIYTVRAALNLIKPSVKEAVGSSLNPVDAENTLTIVVPHYTGMLATDKLSVTWAGTAGAGSHTSAPVDVGTVGIKNIPIPNTVLAFNLGKSVTVTYTVTRNGIPHAPSEAFTLTVTSIPDIRLPLTLINGLANGATLDLSTINGNPVLTTRRWPLIDVNQRVWLRLRGTKANGDIYTLDIWISSAVNANEANVGLNRPILRSEFEQLKHGSRLEVELKVTFDKTSLESNAVRFPLTTYTVSAVELIKPTISSVKGTSSGVEIPNGGTTVETAVTLSGVASKGQKVEVFDNEASKGQATAHLTSGIWTLPVSNLTVAPHSFTAKALYGSGVVSVARTFTIVPDFIVDTSPVTLNGLNLTAAPELNWRLSGNYPAGTTVRRSASGGTLPYTYSSDNSQVVSVDSTGLIIGHRNGSATIKVHDGGGNEKSILVTCSNNFVVQGHQSYGYETHPTPYATMSARMSAAQGISPTTVPGFLQALTTKYLMANAEAGTRAKPLDGWLCGPSYPSPYATPSNPNRRDTDVLILADSSGRQWQIRFGIYSGASQSVYYGTRSYFWLKPL